LYDSNTDVKISNDILINWHFSVKFGVINGYFNCFNCRNLTSLKGILTNIGGDFICSYCSIT